MKNIHMILFKEDDGSVPLIDWFDRIPEKAVDKCRAKMGRLHELGNELRRPVCDYLRDGIYELRASLQGVHYRLLYFFYENKAVVLTHGITKERNVPSREIERAIERKIQFVKRPQEHTYEEENP